MSTGQVSEHATDQEVAVSLERDGHVLLIGLNRPDKRNAFNLAMFDAARAAPTPSSSATPSSAAASCSRTATTSPAASTSPRSRPASATAGSTSASRRAATRGASTAAVDQAGRRRRAGLGASRSAIELLLAADIRVAAADARFAQIEVQRGIYPFGGATIRLPREAGWGNAMRWLLTGDEFDAARGAAASAWSRRSSSPARQLERAVELAETIATKARRSACAPRSPRAQRALAEGEAAAVARLAPDVSRTLRRPRTAPRECMSFIERRPANFKGR